MTGPEATSRAPEAGARSGRRPGSREYRIFLAALGAVGLHVADDNYVHPEPGTSAGDHLASGLVPLGVLVLLTFVYPRLPRPGARAHMSMTVGVLGVMVGVPGIHNLAKGVGSRDDYTGPLPIVAGIVLFAAGPVLLWRHRRPGPTRGRMHARRLLLAVAAVPIAFVTLWLVIFPIGFPYVYTHVGQTKTEPELAIPSERVTTTSEDSLELAATYVPSENRAAVIVFPGATRADEAAMIARHGYGVLLLEPRGQGASEGDIVRWPATATSTRESSTWSAVLTSIPVG